MSGTVCVWPDCLSGEAAVRLAGEVARELAGEIIPVEEKDLTDYRKVCRCVEPPPQEGDGPPF